MVGGQRVHRRTRFPTPLPRAHAQWKNVYTHVFVRIKGGHPDIALVQRRGVSVCIRVLYTRLRTSFLDSTGLRVPRVCANGHNSLVRCTRIVLTMIIVRARTRSKTNHRITINRTVCEKKSRRRRTVEYFSRSRLKRGPLSVRTLLRGFIIRFSAIFFPRLHAHAVLRVTAHAAEEHAGRGGGGDDDDDDDGIRARFVSVLYNALVLLSSFSDIAQYCDLLRHKLRFRRYFVKHWALITKSIQLLMSWKKKNNNNNKNKNCFSNRAVSDHRRNRSFLKLFPMKFLAYNVRCLAGIYKSYDQTLDQAYKLKTFPRKIQNAVRTKILRKQIMFVIFYLGDV